MNRKISPEARAAAEWWSQKLYNPEFATDGSAEALVDTLGASILERPAKAACAAFGENLAQRVQKLIDQSEGYFRIELRGDVVPSPDLLNSVLAVGILYHRWLFPHKTRMVIRPGQVTVRQRYSNGGREIKIYDGDVVMVTNLDEEKHKRRKFNF